MPHSVSTRFKAIDRMSKVFKRMGNRATNSMNRIRRGVKRVNVGVKQLGKNLGVAGKIGGTILAAFSFQAITSQIADTIEVGKTFEQTMITASAKFPGEIRKGTEQFKLLATEAKNVGKTTEFGASEAAEGLDFLALAGFNATQSMASLTGVVDLATISNDNLANSTEVATDTMGAFNLVVKDNEQLQTNLTRVTDVMAKTSTTASTSVSQLFEAIKKGGGVANAAGIDIEKFSAIAGLIAPVVKAGDAGTSIKNIFIRLQSPLAKAKKQFKSLGIDVVDSSGNLKDFSVILDDLNRTLPKGVKRAEALNDIFGKIPIAAVNKLLQVGGQRLRDYTKELEGARGTTKKLAETMRDSTSGAMKTLSSSIEGLKIQLFEAFAPTLVLIVNLLTKFTRIIMKGVDMLGPFAPMILDLVLAFGAAAAVVVTFITVVALVTKAWALLNLVFAASPIGMIVIAIGAVIFVIIQLVKHFDIIKKTAQDVWKKWGVWIGLLMPPLWITVKTIQLIIKGLKAIGVLSDKKIKIETDIDDPEFDDRKAGLSGLTNPQVASSNANVNAINQTTSTIEKSEVELTIKSEDAPVQVTKQTGSPKSFKLDLPPSWAF